MKEYSVISLSKEDITHPEQEVTDHDVELIAREVNKFLKEKGWEQIVEQIAQHVLSTKETNHEKPHTDRPLAADTDSR